MSEDKRELKAGSRLIVTLTKDDTGEVALREEHEVLEVVQAKGATRGAGPAAVQTRLVSQQWLDPELAALNAGDDQAPKRATRGAAGAAEAAKFGLDVARFAWEVVKDNKAVVDAKATTTCVLYKGTGGMDYQGARPAKASPYTLSVHDSLIKSWELIHAEVACEGTFGATPRADGIPQGQYLPAVQVYSPKASADWPCQVSVAATVSDVSVMGSGSLDPMVTILVGIDYGWIAQKRHVTVKFTARGSQGFRRG